MELLAYWFVSVKIWWFYLWSAAKYNYDINTILKGIVETAVECRVNWQTDRRADWNLRFQKNIHGRIRKDCIEWLWLLTVFDSGLPT